jgi:putative addiction module killer protein
MKRVLETSRFRRWLDHLRDRQAVARINTRIVRLSLGLPGDAKSVGDGVRELRFAFGPGYRVYFAERDGALIVLLAGGDKASQRRDIDEAKALWRSWRMDHD